MTVVQEQVDESIDPLVADGDSGGEDQGRLV